MKTATGTCKYCGQITTLEVPERFTQEMIDEEAVKKCDCPEAKAFTKQQETIAAAEGMIKDFFDGRMVYRKQYFENNTDIKNAYQFARKVLDYYSGK